MDQMIRMKLDVLKSTQMSLPFGPLSPPQNMTKGQL